MTSGFEFVPHTADVAAVVRGEDLKRLFENAALALFSVLADPKSVREAESDEIEVRSLDREGLLVDWLNELLFLFETERKLYCRFEVRELSDDHLRAEAWGEMIDLGRHRLRSGVKAATYHDLEIVLSKAGWTARVVFDV